jgi:Skp family chaperone for outer membrane proteins
MSLLDLLAVQEAAKINSDHGPATINMPFTDFTAIYAAAKDQAKVEADLRAEMADRMSDMNDLEKELESVKKVAKDEEIEADSYAKKMHAAHEVVVMFHDLFVKRGMELPASTDPELIAKLNEVLKTCIQKGGAVNMPVTSSPPAA